MIVCAAFKPNNTRARGLEAQNHTTTCRRVNRLDIGLKPRLDTERPVNPTVDASGIKVADGGEWIRLRWRRRGGFLEIHWL